MASISKFKFEEREDMKLDEDFHREVAFQTDDEENQAENKLMDDFEEDTASINSLEFNNSVWPQSYRESMDMLKGVTPPSIIFSSGNSITASFFRSQQTMDEESPTYNEPLLPETSLHEQEPTSTLLALHQKASLKESTSSQTKKCSFTQALLNGANVLCGIGLLTTPYALKEGGWLSLLLLLLYGIIACYTGILLKRCLESSPALQTYPDIGQAAFGVPGRLLISVMLYAELYAACVEFVIMMRDNLSTLFPDASLAFSGIYLDAQQMFAIIGALVVLPTVWLRDLSLLSYLSVGGLGASILVVLCLLWIGTVDQLGFHRVGTALDFANLPISVGIYGFCFAGHAVFPNIYTSMKEPSLFPIIIIVSFIFCGLACTGSAISGFMIFGDSTKSQITVNMPIKFFASKMAVWTVVIIAISKYALTLTPIALSLEELISSATKFRTYGLPIIIRTVLVISTLVVEMKVPFFAFLMALAGSLLAMLLALIFPCACYLRLLGGKVTVFQKAVCTCICIIGFTTACFGTYSAVLRIVGELN